MRVSELTCLPTCASHAKLQQIQRHVLYFCCLLWDVWIDHRLNRTSWQHTGSGYLILPVHQSGRNIPICRVFLQIIQPEAGLTTQIQAHNRLR